MGTIQNGSFISSYYGNQIDALLAAMAQANPLPSGTDWVAFIDDCVAAQTAAESAQAAAEAAATAAETWSSNPPYIDQTTGNWFVYNTQSEQFVNSGVHAQGPTGATGADGVSPAVTIGTVAGGHSVTITDKDHPSGQSFNVMDGGMQASQYDPQGAVAAAGGIPDYVLGQITHSVYRAVTLLAANWSGNTQTVTVTGVSATETDQLIQPVPASASRSEYQSCGVQATAQAANSLTFSCAETPSNDLTVYVVLTELEAAT